MARLAPQQPLKSWCQIKVDTLNKAFVAAHMVLSLPNPNMGDLIFCAVAIHPRRIYGSRGRKMT
jgi:hypothetical protein